MMPYGPFPLIEADELPPDSGYYVFPGLPQGRPTYLPTPEEIAEEAAKMRENFRHELWRNKHQPLLNDYDRVGNIPEFNLGSWRWKHGDRFRDVDEYELFDSEYWNQVPEP